eukprot:2941257-Pleurochrysis_carterae.AAC.2
MTEKKAQRKRCLDLANARHTRYSHLCETGGRLSANMRRNCHEPRCAADPRPSQAAAPLSCGARQRSPMPACAKYSRSASGSSSTGAAPRSLQNTWSWAMKADRSRGAMESMAATALPLTRGPRRCKSECHAASCVDVADEQRAPAEHREGGKRR